MKRNILAENMKRFGTKNLNDSDSIRNTKGVISEQSQQLKSIDSKPASLATRDGSFFEAHLEIRPAYSLVLMVKNGPYH
jgi:hypothetical protein